MAAAAQSLRAGAPALLDYKPALDGLRGLAIVVVMLFHAKVLWARGGWLGVDVFFVLSGYLITTLLVAEHDRHGRINLRHFYLRRVLRLAPALLALLVAFCAASALFVFPPKARLNYEDALIALFYLSNWARAFGIHPPDYLGHTWSLSIEEQFYLAWPALLLLLLRLPMRRGALAAAVAALAVGAAGLRLGLLEHGATAMRLYNGTDTRADSLLLGCAVALWLSLPGARAGAMASGGRRVLVAAAGPLALLVLAHLAAGTPWSADWVVGYGYFAIAVLATLLLAHLLVDAAGPLARVLSTPVPVWIGRRSYGLYLFHYPIFRAMQDEGMATSTVVVAGGLATFAAAEASYRLLERPALRLKRRFPHRPGPAAPAGATPSTPLPPRSPPPTG